MLDGVHFYNQTLKKSVAVFGTIFNNIKIVRKGTSETRVPLAYGPRSKFLARIQQDTSLEDQKLAIKLPRMSFEITSIDRDSVSALNKSNVKLFNKPGTELSKSVLRQSVPYKLGMQLNILAKTQDEALQIFEQILPTFVPEYTVAIRDMEGDGNTVDVPITLTNTSFEDDYENDFTTRRTIIYTLDFEMKVRFTGRVVTKPVIRAVIADLYNNSTEDSASTAVDRVKTELGSDTDTREDHTANTTFGF
jgi:hypothetical protein|tara:strand:- start:664 stop:1410 length:747 start_codon:yes stop_codon:yes gene_type:complete